MNSTDAMRALALRGVSKRFADGTLALDRLDLSVEQGTITCLVGPSGCGKSSALRVLAGLLEADSGDVDRPAQDDLAFVFQEPTLMPWRRVLDNVRLPLQLKGVGRSESREAAEAALELVGLSEFCRSFPRQLSGGMKMRVSIARALVTQPRVLLLDEPFAALDELTRFRLNDELLRLWQDQNWTVVFVTHSVYEAVYLASRVIVMTSRPGRVCAEIPVEAPYQRFSSFRESADYTACCSKVSRALTQAHREESP